MGRPVLLAGVLLLAPACGGGDPAEPGRTVGGDDLLGRRPDVLLHESGVLSPDQREQWGPHGRHGWDGYTTSFDGGSWLGVWMRRQRAGLSLPALDGRPRELVLTVAAPRGPRETPGPLRASLRLNGIPIGAFDVPEGPAEVALATPEGVWLAGDNSLELEVDRLEPDAPAPAPGAPGHAPGPGEPDAGRDAPDREAAEPGARRVGLVLARLEYGQPLEPAVDVAERRLVLFDGTGAGYRIEELAPGGVRLAAVPDAAGRLEVQWRHVDPRRGTTTSTDEPLVLEIGPEGIDRVLPMPPARGELLELFLTWRADDRRAALAVRRLERVEEPARPRPPIVLVMIDTLAAKNLSLHGYPRETTPHLARFAEEAVVFERCLANAPWTMPSVFSTMTGLWPAAHQIASEFEAAVPREAWEQWYLAPNRWTLAESLRAAGYRTGGFTEHLWLTPRYGFPQGFDAYDTSACEYEATDPEGGTRHVSGRAIAWLDELPAGAPFFLFLHTFDVHGPYAPEPPWKGRFRDDELFRQGREVPAGGMHNTFGAVPAYVLEAEYAEGVPSAVDSARVRAAYDEGVAMVDQLLEDFFERLRARGLFDEALILVTADHGETMDRGPYLFGHGVLEEEVLHVPLLVRFPGGANGGRRVATTVQLVDLYPTLLDWVGIPREGRPLHGRSILPLARGEAMPERVAYAEGGIQRQAVVELNGWRLLMRAPADRSSHEVLLTHPDAPADWLATHFPELQGKALSGELFARIRARPDFAARMAELRERMAQPRQRLTYAPDDPEAAVDLSLTRGSKLARLRELLERCSGEQREAHADARPPTDLVELPPDQVEKLRQLGYAGD